MRVAVTGSSGYLGQLVVQALAGDPAVDSILGLDVRPSGFASPKLTDAFADVRTADFERLLAGCDAVYHLAFIVQAPKGMSLETIDWINIEGSRRVFAAAARAGVRKIVYASSVAAYGAHPDNPLPMTEDSPLRPNDDWFYARTKGRVERLLDRLQARRPELVIVRFRPGIFLGPTTSNTMGKMFASRVMFCVQGDKPVDLCWDADVTEAFRLGLHHDRSETFNLTGADPLPLIEYARLVGKRMIPVPTTVFRSIVHGAHAARLLADADYEWARALVAGPVIVSADRARERLGWKPQYDAAGTLLAFARSWGLLK